jgi:DNA-binding NtrC family response regulator
MSEGDQLGIADFPLIPAHAPIPVEHAPPLVVERPAPPAVPAMVSGNEIPIAPLTALGQPGTLSMLSANGEMRPLEELENEIIRFAIAHYRGQMSEVARRLKIGRSTLYRKLDEAVAEGAAQATPSVG